METVEVSNRTSVPFVFLNVLFFMDFSGIDWSDSFDLDSPFASLPLNNFGEMEVP